MTKGGTKKLDGTTDDYRALARVTRRKKTMSAVTNFASSIISGVGSAASGAKTAVNQVKNQEQIYGASGESESLEAQRRTRRCH